MKKIVLIAALFLLFEYTGFSQTRYQAQIDSLNIALTKATTDSTRLNLLIDILSIYALYKPGEGIIYKDAALTIAARTNKKINIARINHKIGRIYW